MIGEKIVEVVEEFKYLGVGLCSEKMSKSKQKGGLER